MLERPRETFDLCPGAYQAPSKVDLDFSVTGKAAHAGVCPEEGINAIVAAAKAIASLRTGRIDRRTTSNVGLISGGRIRNMVADRAEVIMEVRSTDAARLETEVQAVLNAFQEAAASAGAGEDEAVGHRPGGARCGAAAAGGLRCDQRR